MTLEPAKIAPSLDRGLALEYLGDELADEACQRLTADLGRFLGGGRRIVLPGCNSGAPDCLMGAAICYRCLHPLQRSGSPDRA